MSNVSTNVKALLSLTGKDHAGLASYLGISKQALSNKLYRGSFSAEDLIKIGNYTGATLCYTLPNGAKVVLSEDLTKD